MTFLTQKWAFKVNLNFSIFSVAEGTKRYRNQWFLPDMFFPYLSSFQNGLKDLSTPNGSVFILDNAKGYTYDI